VDLTVWPEASSIILVGTSAPTTRRALTLGKPIEAVFERPKVGIRQWAKALRVHQWAKNALVFVPLGLSGMATNPAALIQSLIAFVVISLMASGTYLVNDLADLTDDRAHWSKKHRPLAAGVIALKHGVVAAAGLIGVALALATTLGLPALGLIVGYMALTLSYSFYLKRQPIVDVFALAVLFTLRIGIGIAAIAVEPSPWLLVFSMFLFGSLSFAKRQTEIQRSVANGRKAVNGRGYLGTDAGFVLSMGIAAGMGAVSIMVLYIMNDVYAATIYKTPVMLWVFPAVLFMWISRIWLLCHREQLNDDPVAFAIRDKVSIGLGGIMGAAFLWGWLI
jgi:4-hydroxybenzoate polyprenyltransferase